MPASDPSVAPASASRENAPTQTRSLYMTAPDEVTAKRLARALLEERLVACVNIFPAGMSLYWWEGEIQEEPEVVMIAKSRAALLPRVIARVRELHPYDTPCVVALQVDGGDPRYLAWVEAATAAASSPNS